ncbi:MAG: (2Fe-2S) ferredoxin domain-containing protein [Trichodesmium sp. MAG_R04]|nr:(2Fe-2S) ferredoxin domain-containing protein [Trichodesmium sp. MAG_R04]
MVENSKIERCLLVCQNHTCCKRGSAKVLATFQTFDTPNITVDKSGCLVKCGHIPMILVGIASFYPKVPNVGIFILFPSVTNTLPLGLSTVKLQ